MSEQWGVGDRASEKAFDLATVGDDVVELIFGEHPHSRRDNNVYARWPSGRIEGFDGHRILWRVDLEQYNYLKSSSLSGNEVREGGTGRIYADGQQVYQFFFRDIDEALIRARSIKAKIIDRCSDWAKADRRQKLIGRKVYWRDSPAIVERLLVEDGHIILRHDGDGAFPVPAWARDDDEMPYEASATVKTEVTDENIWWFRKTAGATA